MNIEKRLQNERKFKMWFDLPDGGRRYYFDIEGRVVGFARYVKIVNSDEETMFFGQEIYNAIGVLIETHEKFPNDSGHIKL